MQNSLERIFEGLEHTLRQIIAPSLTDSYLLSQVTAVAEIIGNLSARVEWKSEELLATTERVRPILERAAAATSDGLPKTRALLAATAPTAASPNQELLQRRDEHLDALREVQRSLDTRGDDDVENAIRDFLGWQVAHEASLLRTGTSSPAKK